jgi:hypothetical protein
MSEQSASNHELSIHIARLREPKYNGDAMELRKWAAAEIERLKQKLTAAEQLAVRQGNEIRRLQRVCRDQAERQQS